MTARTIQYVPLPDVIPALRNPKLHDIEGLRRSMTVQGFTAPAVLDGRTGRLIEGHGRLEALTSLRDDGADPPDGIRVVKGEWLIPVVVGWASVDDAAADAMLVWANQSTMNPGWDQAGLSDLLTVMESETLLLTGFDEGTFVLMEADLILGLGGPGYVEPDDKGEALHVLDVSIAEPTHQVQSGEVWRLGRHTLVVASVMTDWPMWAPLLTGGVVFTPYPSPYVALSVDKSSDDVLVMVQPDTYLAGHVLDKWVSVKGSKQCRRVDH